MIQQCYIYCTIIKYYKNITSILRCVTIWVLLLYIHYGNIGPVQARNIFT